MTLPTHVDMIALVRKHVSKMNVSASPGFDVIAAPFIKQAVLREQGLDGRTQLTYVLEPYLTSLFHLMLHTAHIPPCWKQAKLSPLFKKGLNTDPNNYRMLAVSANYMLTSFAL